MKRPSFLYRFLKVYCRIGLWFYFRQWQIHGKENVPVRGPVIFVANHQNAFLDPILITCSTARNPFYLARGSVFIKKWAAYILSLIRLKPIYRFRDGFGTLKNNDAIIQECIELLRNGESILIFAEGDHHEPWSIGPFQKGFARMALQYYEQTKDTSLQIVPIGLHFTDHHAFNSRVLLHFGQPFCPTDFIRENDRERENLDRLVTHCRKGILALTVDIKPSEEYEARKDYFLRNRAYAVDMIQQVLQDREVLKKYPVEGNPSRKISMGYWLALPNLLYLYLTHGLLKLALYTFIKQKVSWKFIGSIKFAGGIFVTPVYYALLSAGFCLLTGDGILTLVFLVSLPLTLLIGKRWPSPYKN
jgi:1-acyl-sn-glycerol-3-phosphate acyltransferase